MNISYRFSSHIVLLPLHGFVRILKSVCSEKEKNVRQGNGTTMHVKEIDY